MIIANQPAKKEPITLIETGGRDKIQEVALSQ